MKNIFSATESSPEVAPEFAQQQPATAPTAPECVPHLPATAPAGQKLIAPASAYKANPVTGR